MPLATKNYFKMGILSQKKKNSVLTKSQPVKLFFLGGGGGVWGGLGPVLQLRKALHLKKIRKPHFFTGACPEHHFFTILTNLVFRHSES